jgi:hypothetical protein
MKLLDRWARASVLRRRAKEAKADRRRYAAIRAALLPQITEVVRATHPEMQEPAVEGLAEYEADRTVRDLIARGDYTAEDRTLRAMTR